MPLCRSLNSHDDAVDAGEISEMGARSVVSTVRLVATSRIAAKERLASVAVTVRTTSDYLIPPRPAVGGPVGP